MKLIIQIPCFNESAHLPETVACLPRAVPGFETVEYLVIDDGSSDNTSAVARESGVHHVVRHTRNQGLARAFETGIAASLRAGADVIVNTDADNQYCADDIPLLTAPILVGEADIVVGARPISTIEHFSPVKKLLQRIGSAVVRLASRTSIPDAPSGFRAYSKAAAKRVHVFNNYTYTLETIIQAGQDGTAIRSVPIRVNGPTRRSRLVRSIPSYVRRSIATILRIFITYRPFLFFSWLSAGCLVPGALIGARFVYYYLQGHGEGKVQSLLLATLLIGSGLMLLVVGILADLTAANRKLLERIQLELKEHGELLRNSTGRDRTS